VAAPGLSRDDHRWRSGYIIAIVVSAIAHVGVVLFVLFVVPRLLASETPPPMSYSVKIVDSIPAGDPGTRLPAINGEVPPPPERHVAKPEPTPPPEKPQPTPPPANDCAQHHDANAHTDAAANARRDACTDAERDAATASHAAADSETDAGSDSETDPQAASQADPETDADADRDG
jgi:type IV secretory pathway VirB10-like protein